MCINSHNRLVSNYGKNSINLKCLGTASDQKLNKIRDLFKVKLHIIKSETKKEREREKKKERE